MKNKIALSILLSFGIFSCASSCGSCVQEPTRLVVKTCDASDCSTTIFDSADSGGFVEVLDASIKDINSVCSEDSHLVCQPLPTSSEIKTELVTGDGWHITLPLGLQKKSSSNTSIVFSVFRDKKEILLVLLKEQFNSSFEQYVLSTLRGIKDTGSTIVSSKSLQLNGSKFILLESIKNDIKIWTLVSVKNGFGYGLSCGGPSPHDVVHDVCASITDSFTLE